MKLYFVRHGQSEANIRHVISNRESPFGLTQLGKQQANTLAENLRNIPFTAIFSSPVRRARETAEILSESFHIPYQVTEALREYDCGILEGKSDEASWRLHREIAEAWTRDHNYQRRPDGGECFLDIRDRFMPFIESLKHSKEEYILLVGHGGLFQLMLPLVLSNVEDDFVGSNGIGHTVCVVAEYISGEFVCKQWGDVRL